MLTSSLLLALMCYKEFQVCIVTKQGSYRGCNIRTGHQTANMAAHYSWYCSKKNPLARKAFFSRDRNQKINAFKMANRTTVTWNTIHCGAAMISRVIWVTLLLITIEEFHLPWGICLIKFKAHNLTLFTPISHWTRQHREAPRTSIWHPCYSM